MTNVLADSSLPAATACAGFSHRPFPRGISPTRLARSSQFVDGGGVSFGSSGAVQSVRTPMFRFDQLIRRDMIIRDVK
ncbi:MAG: hypothetical protein WBL61_19300, partial [Bryobacteraceae bacterium]